jgi:hypothetical protein
MAYCLWDALKMREPRLDNFSGTLLDEAESAFRKLISFLSTMQCLRWYELSTIINHAGNFEQLLDRIIEALQIAQKEDRKDVRLWT